MNKYFLSIIVLSILLVVGLQCPTTSLGAFSGQISGRVTNSLGSPIYRAIVVATLNDGSNLNATSTDSDGKYSLNVPYAGEWKIGFSHPDYLNTWYIGAADSSLATPIVITGTSTSYVIDSVLESGGGKISGRVTTWNGKPEQRYDVYIYSELGGLVEWIPGASDIYTSNGLATGSYKVKIISAQGVPHWYNDASNIETATSVSVNAPEISTGINIVNSYNVVLWLFFEGAGEGSVHSVPSGISCDSGGTCDKVYDYPPCIFGFEQPYCPPPPLPPSASAYFPVGTTVTLIQTPTSNSGFNGWSGVCTGSGDCTVTLTDNVNITASFILEPFVKNKRTGVAYNLLQNAYSDAIGGDTIKIRADLPIAPLILDKSTGVTIEGGYDASLSTQSGTTSVRGPINIKFGTLRVIGIAVKP